MTKTVQKIEPQKPFPENALEKWRHIYEKELAAVNELVIEFADDTKVPLIGQLARHVIQSGGKRMRPILAVLSAKMFGYKGDRHIKLAAAIEFIHTATLLHDDVVDESKLRRGRATANAEWGNAASVLVGDFLLSRAFQIMARDGNLKVLRVLSDASATISAGEVHQLAAQNNLATNQEIYIEIISAKTAKLFSAGCEVGAIVADRPDAEEKALADFGQYLGIAFQIVDDVLDYSAKQEQLGKTIGDDFREGKVTLPIIFAYEKANEEEKKFWQRVIENKDQKDGDLAQAIKLINNNSILMEAMKVAVSYSEKATLSLKNFSECKEKEALLDLLQFCINRPY